MATPLQKRARRISWALLMLEGAKGNVKLAMKILHEEMPDFQSTSSPHLQLVSLVKEVRAHRAADLAAHPPIQRKQQCEQWSYNPMLKAQLRCTKGKRHTSPHNFNERKAP